MIGLIPIFTQCHQVVWGLWGGNWQKCAKVWKSANPAFGTKSKYLKRSQMVTEIAFF